jgi:hypothetical protein
MLFSSLFRTEDKPPIIVICLQAIFMTCYKQRYSLSRTLKIWMFENSRLYLNTYLLTQGSEPFLGGRQLCSHLRTSQHFMEPEGSIPCSQEPCTGPYPEPYPSYLSKIHLNIVHTSASWSSQWHYSMTWNKKHLIYIVTKNVKYQVKTFRAVIMKNA